MLTLAIASCTKAIIGEGQVVSQNRSVTKFDSVEVTGNFNVIIKYGSTPKLTVKTNQNLQEYTRSYVNARVLFVRSKYLVDTRPSKETVITITTPKINKVVTTDVSKLKVSGISSDHFVLSLTGPTIANLSGRTESLMIVTSGASTINAKGLQTNEAILRLSGNGKVKVTATKVLTALISGSADVTYYGKPKKLYQRVVGGGSVKAG